MSDNDYDDDYSDDEAISEDTTPKGLRQAANRAKKLERELNTLKRELAFTRAGIPLDDPKMTYFVKGYDGEMTAEAIRQAATEAGFIQSSPQQQDPQQSQYVAAEQRIVSASAGAVVEDASEAAALARLEAAMNEGGVEALLDVARQYGIPTHIES